MKQKFTMPTGEVVERDFPIFKTPYNHDTNFESDRTGYYDDEPSLTKQEYAEHVDINVIIQRALATGEPPPLALPDHFATVEPETFFDMACKIADANALFYELPADIRARSLNDPARWADSVGKALAEGDEKEIRRLGIDGLTTKPQDGDRGTPSTPVAPPTNAAPAAPEAATPPGAPK